MKNNNFFFTKYFDILHLYICAPLNDMETSGEMLLNILIISCIIILSIKYQHFLHIDGEMTQ